MGQASAGSLSKRSASRSARLWDGRLSLVVAILVSALAVAATLVFLLSLVGH
jgi:hypothetical protein